MAKKSARRKVKRKVKKSATRKAIRKPARKKRAKVSRKKPAKRKKSSKSKAGRHLVKYVERTSTERVMAGKRRKRSKRTQRKVGSRVTRRRRSVGGIGGSGLLTGVVLGGLALYMLTKSSTPTTTYPATLPPLTQTQNYTRNTQSQEVLNYAMAAGLALDSILSLIDRLNNSSDDQVDDIYNNVSLTGDIGAWA